MADGLIRNQVSGIRYQGGGTAVPRLLITVYCLLIPVFCYAEELPDPTRPPAWIFGADGMPGTVLGQGSTESPSSGLQSTIISESRRAAIIDGKTVEMGETHGKARLVEVNEGSVVLRTAQTRRVLTLFPDVKMTHREIKIPKAASTSSGQAPPESAVQPEEFSTIPAVQNEQFLSGHPKEE